MVTYFYQFRESFYNDNTLSYQFVKTRMVNMFLCRMQHLSMKCISLKYIVTANIFLLDTKRNQNITFSLNKNNVDNNRTKQSQIYSQFVFSLEKYADSGQTKFVESIHCF